MHAPQRTHCSSLISALPSGIVIAPTGQTATQASQPQHLLRSTTILVTAVHLSG